MLAKAKPASAPAKDAIVDFFIAEDFRSETDGKVSAVGLYPDRVMVLLVPSDAPEPTAEVPYVVDSAAFLVNVRNLSGEHKVSIEIGNHEVKANVGSTPTHTVQFANSGASVNLVGKFRPLLISSFGVKDVLVRVDEVEFKRTFEVRRGEAPPGSPLPRPITREPVNRPTDRPAAGSTRTKKAGKA